MGGAPEEAPDTKKELEVSEHVKCLILGSGPAGYTAAIYAARANLSPVVYTGMQMGGQLTTTTEVDNFPGYPDGTDGTAMMEDLKKQAERFGTQVRFGMATGVDFSEKLKKVVIDDNTLILFNADNGAETLHYDWMLKDHKHDASGGWRGVKRDGWEGGHRVPFIARWPGKIPAGQVTAQVTNTTDIFATLASVVNFELPDSAAVDSFDMLPVMLGWPM